MGDLLRQLTDVDVDLLTPSSVERCPSELARRVTSRSARRRVLQVYVSSRNGSVSDTNTIRYYTVYLRALKS